MNSWHETPSNSRRQTPLWVLFVKAILGGLVFSCAYLLAMTWLYGLSFVGAVAVYYLMPFVPFMVTLSTQLVPRMAVSIITLILLVMLQKKLK